MLNLCANLSKQNKHMEAYQYAKKSIMLLQKEMIGDLEEEDKSKQMPANFWTTLQIAYYNQAVELEYLERLQESIESFEKAAEIEGNDSMLAIVEQNIEEISLKMEARRKKKRER